MQNSNVDTRHKPEESDEKSEEIDMWILREGDLKIQWCRCYCNRKIFNYQIKSTLKTHFERNGRLEVVDVEEDC